MGCLQGRRRAPCKHDVFELFLEREFPTRTIWVAVSPLYLRLNGGFDMFQPFYVQSWPDNIQVAIPGLIDSSLAGLVSWQHPGFGAGNPILRHVQFIFQRFPIDGGRVPCGTVVRFFGNSAETDWCFWTSKETKVTKGTYKYRGDAHCSICEWNWHLCSK